MAGALGVRLGGPSAYGGIIIEKPGIGDSLTEDYMTASQHAVRMVSATSLLAVIIAAVHFKFEGAPVTGHGGNIYQAAKRTGIPVQRIIDFSASINPLGVPASAAAAMKKNISRLPHYPEPFAESLGLQIGETLPCQSRNRCLRQWKHGTDLSSPKGLTAKESAGHCADFFRV